MSIGMEKGSTEMAAKHTPGPWTIDRCFDRDHKHSHFQIDAPIPSGLDTKGFSYTVADTQSRDIHISQDEDRANAHLIAAAPEMYRKLEEIWQWLDNIGDGAPDSSPTAKKALNEAAEIRELLDRIEARP
jgi:hypothetical protein